MTLLVLVLAGLGLLALVVAAGTRMLRHHDGQTSSYASGALGNFIDVFDPARARAERDLDSREHQGEMIPSPNDDDRPVRVDLVKGTARIRRTPAR